jgi:hypothetical protein
MKGYAVEEALDFLDLPENTWWRQLQVPWEPDSEGKLSISIHTAERDSQVRIDNMIREGIVRDFGWGTFRHLYEYAPDSPAAMTDGRVLWMSDTSAEIREHAPLFKRLQYQQERGEPTNIVINGLGLGMAVNAALQFDCVAHIDVVDINQDLIALLRRQLPSDRVTLHHADAYAIKWPSGKTWDLAWHDIWPMISDDNLHGMRRLHQKYARRVRWQDSWQKQGCLNMKQLIERAKAGTLSPEEALSALVGYGIF